MINKAFSFCLTWALLLISVLANAQQQDTESGAVNQFFRSNGKIYVIVGVLVIIFLGIVLFLINLDRKISKLEKREKNNL
ncbi:CcmD family protein [Chitinophaga nivalis]|uniref:CcmD family protein n=1 Tax=Chitinophaga nivalis TaxID=2991709 RepID=A0ABT3IEK9_9BACT|nr:CcmD family protein [Chitinophaga nivalis]MCW3467919.1 CcmD family protein [Chitinophaga nivalis]MCW3482390.1 CcmD family protein [Chitinophaga nivalis]